jgi:hypothetical protein
MQGEGCVMNKPGFNEYNALPDRERKYHERVGRAFGLSGYDHFQWLGENGVDNMTAFNRFDRAARKAIGRELYNDLCSLARVAVIVDCIAYGRIPKRAHVDQLTRRLFAYWKKQQRNKE